MMVVVMLVMMMIMFGFVLPVPVPACHSVNAARLCTNNNGRATKNRIQCDFSACRAHGPT